MSAVTTESRERGVWGGWATVGLGVVAGLVLLVGQGLVLGVFAALRGAGQEGFELDTFLTGLAEDGLFFMVTICVGAVIGLPYVLLVIKGRRGPSVRDYLGLVPVSGRTLARALGVVVVFIVLYDGLTAALGRPIVPDTMLRTYETRTSTVLFWFAVVVVAPVVEEVYFRGFFLQGLRRTRLGDWGAIGATSVVFALLHTQYGAYEIAHIVLVGLLLGFMRVRTGSLWTTIVMHGFANLVALLETAWFVSRGAP
jgi:membrane protease YdiL (CAAX protease family)